MLISRQAKRTGQRKSSKTLLPLHEACCEDDLKLAEHSRIIGKDCSRRALRYFRSMQNCWQIVCAT
jgi:hypothetical protein